MTEKELNNLFDNPIVNKSASQKPPWGIVARGDKAKAFWIIVQICSWLRDWKGSQYARVLKVNTWTDGRTIIDFVVGHNSRYKNFTVLTRRIGNDTLLLSIADPDENGATVDMEGKTYNVKWQTVGVEMKDSTDAGVMSIETLPKGEKAGKKSFFRAN